MNVDVIIPTFNAEKEIQALLTALEEQKKPIHEVIVIDSESKDRTAEICRRAGIRWMQIPHRDFDHGRTRDKALRASKGDVAVFLTQDALPADREFLGNLIAPLTEDRVAVSTGRQLPKRDATRMEQLVRAFNYPAESCIRSREDLSRLGIKTFFCSDVCAAYNKEIYFALGGFEYPIRTNEDMFYAAKAINAGYRIAYAAEARVYHSHNLSLKAQYQRNYAQGYEIERHREALHQVAQETEGKKLVKYVGKELLREGRVGSLVHFGLDCCARWMGSRAGRKAYLRG